MCKPVGPSTPFVGSPSLLKTDLGFYMFYEAYSVWATPINRFYK